MTVSKGEIYKALYNTLNPLPALKKCKFSNVVGLKNINVFQCRTIQEKQLITFQNQNLKNKSRICADYQGSCQTDKNASFITRGAAHASRLITDNAPQE